MKEIIKQIIFTGKVLYKEGLVNSHAGNISVRDNDTIYITKTGAMLGYLQEKDIIDVPVWKESEKDKIASSELIVHRAIYQKTDYTAIIHAHPVSAVALSFSIGEKFIPIDNEGKLFLGEVPVIAVEHPSGSPELAEALSNFFKENEKNVVIVKKHGSFVVHNNLNYALKLTSDLEFCSKVYILNASINNQLTK
ncbi:L-fuculose-phosphate aldolase [Persephonella hydrogeniphila]|uniref:L-fuculose-phosphate aldolase n=1 Tax=Persephonella hydrogeniphila TaxID=198703 RepID=A0A285N2H9_9AQUI|nr:class II aldolase/adducin family protein [Persephonella hydrogeniphila]SNZ02226.1 L-fuculose-phosphate aldolase [Persephonella hydrogeniphila]